MPNTTPRSFEPAAQCVSSKGRTTAPTLIAACWLVVAAACGEGTSASGGSAGAGGSGGSGGAGGAGGSGGATNQPVEVAFAARVGGEDFACGADFAGVGTGDAATTFLDFRLYVHDVRLVAGDAEVPVELDQDGVWQTEDVALLDFEDKTGACANGTSDTNTIVRGTVPPGSYSGVRFKVGVPFALNHADAATAPSPLNLSALFWNWQGGHKFVRIDARAEGAATPFNFHLGSTGCDGDPATGGVTACSSPNVVEVSLDGFDASANTIVLDYLPLVAGLDLSADEGGAPGCMSGAQDPECGPMFEALGLDLATGSPSGSPLVFSVE